MAGSIKVGAHSCVINPKDKDAGLPAGDKYGRMFPWLAPCEADETAVVDLGRAASRMDATPAVVDEGLQNRRIPAGFAILGQFVAHDITADRSLLSHHAVAGEIQNFRAPRLDLECLYGEGPVGNPFLYDADDPDKFLLGVNAAGRPDDLPRNLQGVALVGDPRNDVHLLVSQLHVAFLRLHNGVVDRLRSEGTSDERVFEEARRIARWHYEWIVVNEFLPLSAGEETVADVLGNGRRFYDPGENPAIPVEFSDAAYRFGHSQSAPTYRLNDEAGEVTIFPDCLGFRPVAPGRVIDWSHFFDVPGKPPPQPSRRMGASLTHALIDLPEQIVGHTEVSEHHSLASRDLQRGDALGLPSGEAVARVMGVEPLTREECGLDGWQGETPLWYYVLKEAEVRAGGEHLGPVGGRIVSEVLIGLLDADPGSYMIADPGWRATLPSAEPGSFKMADLVAFATETAA